MLATAGCTFPAEELTEVTPCSWPKTWENCRLDWAVPLQVLDSSPLSGNDEPHWLSRLSDHIEIRPRWVAAAKRDQALRVGYGEVLAV